MRNDQVRVTTDRQTDGQAETIDQVTVNRALIIKLSSNTPILPRQILAMA